jgi:O-antigen/teichoic acid export membrane protein
MIKIIAAIGFIQFLTLLVGLIRTKAVAEMSGIAGVGVITMIDQVVQSAALILAFSLPFAALKYLSKSHSQGPDVFRRTYSAFLKLLTILSLVGMAVSLAAVFYFPAIFGKDEIRSYQTLLSLALTGLPAIVLGGFFANVLAAAGRPRASSVTILFSATVSMLAACGGYWWQGLPGLYVCLVGTGWIATICLLGYLRSTLDLPLLVSKSSVVQVLKSQPNLLFFCLMQYPANSLYSLQFLIGRSMTLTVLGIEQAGLLAAAMQITLALGAVLNPANGLYLTPLMNRDRPVAEKLRVAAEFQKTMTLILCVVGLPIVLFPQVVVTLLFSSAFAPGAQFLFLFVAWQFLAQLAGVHQTLLIGLDDLKIYVVIVVAGYLGSIGLCYVLVPLHGVHGVSLSFIAGAATIFVLTWLRLNVKFGYRLPANILLPTFGGFFALLAVGAGFAKVDNWSPRVLLLKASLYFCSLGGLWLCLKPEERRSILDSRKRVGL